MPRVIHRQDLVRRPVRARSRGRKHEEVIGIICVECPGQPQDVEDKALLYDGKVLRGVERRLSDFGWSLLIASWNGEAGKKLSPIAAMLDKVDGILITIGSLPPRLVEQIARQVPVAVIAGDPAERSVDVVTADNKSGSAAIVTHLVEDHGRRRIYHVDGPPSMPDNAQRRSGLLQVLRNHPGTRLVGTTHGSNYLESGLAAGQRMLAECRNEIPDTVVAANDQMAIGVMRSLAAAGIRVPEQIAVVGFDDIYPGELCEPSLTTVHQPIGTLGERACDRLLKRIATPGLPPQVELLATELVLRQSCGCPPGAPARRPVGPGDLTAAEPSK